MLVNLSAIFAIHQQFARIGISGIIEGHSAGSRTMGKHTDFQCSEITRQAIGRLIRFPRE
jgi:hypothetical protein